ncbi:uncharacterized protein [Pyrus communis]|uniref:uncharacterized protein n=1 Tax=Pyrus communis TaxID=23211 RepID=UPI0035C223F6
MANLYQRRSSPSPLCPICKSHDETVEHLFLLCLWVEVIWFRGSLNLRINRTEITTWANWLLQIYDSAKGSKEVRNNLFSYIAFTCWHIWKSRCNFQFNQQQIHPRQVIMASSLSATTFNAVRVVHSISPMPRLSEPIDGGRWFPLSPDFVKINVDASWGPSDGQGFMGVVARDEDGMFLAAGRSGG